MNIIINTFIMEMQPSFLSGPFDHKPVTFHVEQDLSPQEMQQMITQLIETKTGHLIDLPDGNKLCVVRGEDGRQLEWTRLGNGSHSSYIVRDAEKRVLAESEDGSEWKLADGQGTCVIGDGKVVPQALFDERDHVPYYGNAKELD